MPIVPRGKTKAAFDKTGSSSRGGTAFIDGAFDMGNFPQVKG